ncbi:hypothetical protein RBA71_19195 [Brenneria goodwinii]|uniref:hypothetical protein n=1 Tax=Brenneria goodwinii TaxID=1109412 RepID=UPI0036E4FF1D
MIIGFVLLASACRINFCDTQPVTEDIYLNRESCQLMMDIVHERHPNIVLICGEVQRDNNEGEDE